MYANVELNLFSDCFVPPDFDVRLSISFDIISTMNDKKKKKQRERENMMSNPF
jgi:hypothetical protein